MIAFHVPPTFTWWGCASIELAGETERLLVDPYLHPRERGAAYICITHADYDHCHEPTLRRLVAAPSFERLLAAPACMSMSKLDIPHNPDPADLSFVPRSKLTTVRPQFTRNPHAPSGEQPQRFKPDDGTPWPALTGRFAGDEFPNVGYLVTHATSGTAFLHPGDLTDPYDALRDLRGRVDYLFLPTVKLEGVELTLVDAIRPRVVVPIHHRVAAPDFPIPLEITDDELTATSLAHGSPFAGADPAAFRRDVHRMMRAHWYPTPDPSLERFRSLAPAFAELGARSMVVDAGKEQATDA
jgi:L-ascorbate metabolism protein UlaG (beta-lactamase superfamily)